jgi:hypothetical protein
MVLTDAATPEPLTLNRNQTALHAGLVKSAAAE